MVSRYRLCAVVVGVVAALVAAGGCSSFSPSPKEKLVESADEKCDTITERFGQGGDLFYGEGVGGEDMKKMPKRAKLIKDLASHVRGMPKPESDGERLENWLGKLDDLARETETLHGDFKNARMGSDMLLAMQLGIVDDAAKATGPAAKNFGFDSCAHVGAWQNFPEK